MILPTENGAGPVLRRDAVRIGWSDEELARFARSGQWNRVRRGAYVDGQLPTGAVAQHALLIAAPLGSLRRPAVISHQSAAVLLGLPVWCAPLDRVHITRCPPASSQAGGPLRCHVARLRDDEVSLPFEQAVVSVDAALHEGLLSRELLEQRLFDIAGT